MDDPVLHRKMFRHAALRSGALKPRSYQVGAPEFGVSTQVASRNPAYTAPTQVFEKGGVRYFVNAAGQIIGTERTNPLQIEYKPSMGTKISNKFFDIAERFVSPEGYSKNIQSLKNIGSALTKGETYVKGAKTVGRGVKSLVNPALIAPALAVDKGLEEAGLGEASTLAYLGSEGARAAGKALTSKPGAVRSTIGYGLRAAGLPASVRALGTRAMMTPMGAGITAAAAVPYGMYKLDQYLRQPKKVYDPEKKIYVDVESDFAKQDRYMNSPEGREIFTPMSPDDMMNFQQQTALENQATPAAAASAMPGSDLATTGEIPSGTTDMGQGTGGTGTPPGGQQVSLTGGDGGPEKIGKTEVPTNVNSDLNKKTDELNKGKKKTPAEENKKGLFDRLSEFSRTQAGNLFMLKFAAGLLTGKGGFGEVVGNALNPAVDVLAAYDLKQQELDNKLLVEQYKSLKDSIGTPKTGTLPIARPDGRISYVPAERDDKTGNVTYVQTLPDGTKQIVTADRELRSLYLEKDIKAGSKQLELIGKLGDNTGASAIITDLLLQNPQTLGTSGAVKLFGSRLASVVGAVKDIGKDVSYKDIIDINTGKVVSGEEAARMQGLEKSVDKNIEAMFGQMDDKTRQTLAANGVRAETLKYFLANAFKSEDRLTNRDLEFIGKITNVLAFTKGGNLVQAELKEIQTYLDKKRETFIRQLNNSGYSDLDVATNIFGTSGGVIAGSIYGSQKNIVPDFRNMLPGDVNKKLLEQNIKG
jgi:hypothetical protein